MSEARIQAISNNQKLKNHSDFRAILGLQDIFEISLETTPLAQSLSAAFTKTEPNEVIWIPERENAFYMLKNAYLMFAVSLCLFWKTLASYIQMLATQLRSSENSEQ